MVFGKLVEAVDAEVKEQKKSTVFDLLRVKEQKMITDFDLLRMRNEVKWELQRARRILVK